MKENVILIQNINDLTKENYTLARKIKEIEAHNAAQKNRNDVYGQSHAERELDY